MQASLLSTTLFSMSPPVTPATGGGELGGVNMQPAIEGDDGVRQIPSLSAFSTVRPLTVVLLALMTRPLAAPVASMMVLDADPAAPESEAMVSPVSEAPTVSDVPDGLCEDG